MMPLKTETNTAAMGARVLLAARRALAHELVAVFEHGQWWITNRRTGAQWAVCDAEGPGSVQGFSFELVTEGEEGN